MDSQLVQVEEHEHEHIVPKSVYLTIFGALMVLTAVTVGAAYVNLPMSGLNVTVALAIAIVKASLVVLFFMHVKYSSRLIQLVVLASIVWLIILLGITLTDYVTRGWITAPPLVR